MRSTNHNQSHSPVLKYAIQHDIEDIDDLDEFLTVDEQQDDVLHALCCAYGVH